MRQSTLEFHREMYATESKFEVAECMRKNGLALAINNSETKYMCFGYAPVDDLGHRVTLHALNRKHEHCDCAGIQRTTTYKYQGLTIQDNLKYDMHISHVKISSRRTLQTAEPRFPHLEESRILLVSQIPTQVHDLHLWQHIRVDH